MIYTPVKTMAELRTLDSDEIVSGYLVGVVGSMPDPEKSRSWQHGWGNGAVDGGWAVKNDFQIELARVYVANGGHR